MVSKKADDVRRSVRQAYSQVVQAASEGNCCGEANSCCGVPAGPVGIFSTRLGYSEEDLRQVPEGADMGLGCGNPRAIASLKPGEVVLDLGSGGGFDCFLAAREVGDAGHIIGVDMTSEMVSKARENADRGGFGNVEFRLGEIEHLPVADQSVDVIISNCVINLSPDKAQVFREALRVLKSGGRLAVSDVVAKTELPDGFRNDPLLFSGCMGGALLIEDLTALMADAGFRDVRVTAKDESREFMRDWAPERNVTDYLVSAHIEAVRP